MSDTTSTPARYVSDVEWPETFEQIETTRLGRELPREPPEDRVPCTATELGLPDTMDGDAPLVSVVIPTYEDHHYLPDALESIGYQTYDNIEVILVDSSGIEWIEQLATDREWIRYRSQEPGGLSRARNDAIELARGCYVALIDADDYWHPEKLERQLAAFAPEEGSISYTAFFDLAARNDTTQFRIRDRTLPNPSHAWRDRTHSEILAIPSTIVFRRAVLPDRPFEDSLEVCEDLAFLVEQFIEEPPVHVPEPLTVKRAHPESISHDDKRTLEHTREAIDYLLSQYGAEPNIRQALVDWQRRNEQQLGKWYRENGELRMAQECFAEAEFLSGTRRLEAGDEAGARQHFGKALDLIHDDGERRLHRRIGREWLDYDKTQALRHFLASLLP